MARLQAMSAPFKQQQKAFLSPTDVAELTAAAVAALPPAISQAAAGMTLTSKKASTTHRADNGDIVHHHQSTHRGGNATLVTSTTTTIHGGAKQPAAATTTTTTASLQQQQFSIHASHSHGHHHHHHLAHGASLLANGSLSGLAGPGGAAAGALMGPGVDGALAANGATSLAASPTFQGDLNKIDQGLNSEDADVQLEAAKKLRVLLSSERDLLIRQVIDNDRLAPDGAGVVALACCL